MKKLLALFAGATALAFVATAAPAVTLTPGDVGESGTTSINGLVNGVVVPGLTGTLQLTFDSVTGGGTTWNFHYTIDNTSSGGITSELSGFCLNTTPNVLGGSATGLYDNVFIQSQFSSGTTVDFCASAGASCPGGSSNGISPSDPAATGTFSLIFSTAQASIGLDTAFFRYQAISGNGFNGASGIGFNNNVSINPLVSPVPLPAAFPLFAGGLALFGGVAGWRKRRAMKAAAAGLVPAAA